MCHHSQICVITLKYYVLLLLYSNSKIKLLMLMKFCFSEIVSLKLCLWNFVSETMSLELCLWNYVSETVSLKLCLWNCVSDTMSSETVSLKLCLWNCVSETMSLKLCLWNRVSETVSLKLSLYSITIMPLCEPRGWQEALWLVALRDDTLHKTTTPISSYYSKCYQRSSTVTTTRQELFLFRVVVHKFPFIQIWNNSFFQGVPIFDIRKYVNFGYIFLIFLYLVAPWGVSAINCSSTKCQFSHVSHVYLTCMHSCVENVLKWQNSGYIVERH